MPFFSLWGEKEPEKTPKEKLREAKRNTRRQTRDIERQIKTTSTQQKKIEKDMKKHAGENRLDCAKALAKQLVRMKKQESRLYQTNAQLNGMSMQADQMNNQMVMTEAMRSGVEVMSTFNETMDPLQVQQMAAQFQVEQQKNEMTSEMFDDMFDELYDDEEEASDEVNKIMEELAHMQLNGVKGTAGLKTADQLAAEQQPVANQQGPMLAGGEDEEDDIMSRLAALRKP
eukprot:TRINITY_DN17817_c0_g1_i2.p1 TRINITY_DN17817_c0_g1~~TRINITY_DN17817_c0_g1_i2.p1  ORF type:complete len:229 (-),score=87.08 TRINITY_DN17817_c0_g1_i2:471-1157(-)